MRIEAKTDDRLNKLAAIKTAGLYSKFTKIKNALAGMYVFPVSSFVSYSKCYYSNFQNISQGLELILFIALVTAVCVKYFDILYNGH